ncbi:hypothetical protein M0813_02115 [Anaeramoeba flamelloides]|uniref:Ribosomal protein eL8/eL30/eS12/Gadd45 domain-containing protein n=1 Tax=Anaeramoeba flamelloides TaxID=1746091 RepID=A0ABQ8YQH6_9EUKA|nr:hypothetical protein M0813_02115 [Anaeramoeba flamelloides]
MTQRKRQKQKPKQKSTILNLDGQVFKNKEARKKKKPSKLKKTLVNQRKNKEFAETAYYDYTPTLDLDLCVLTFLSKLFKIQTKTKITNTKKKKKTRRYVFGIREVYKYASLGKLCVVIIPTNVDNTLEIHKIINDIRKQPNTHLIFSCSRKKLGSIFKKTLRISMIGVFDKSGADLLFARMLMLAKIERKKERLKLLQNNTSQQLKETETETETEKETEKEQVKEKKKDDEKEKNEEK